MSEEPETNKMSAEKQTEEQIEKAGEDVTKDAMDTNKEEKGETPVLATDNQDGTEAKKEAELEEPKKDVQMNSDAGEETPSKENPAEEKATDSKEQEVKKSDEGSKVEEEESSKENQDGREDTEKGSPVPEYTPPNSADQSVTSTKAETDPAKEGELEA